MDPNQPYNPARSQLKDEELLREVSAQQVRRQSKWTYIRKEQIMESSPSGKDGLDPAKEAAWRRSYLHLIQEAGMKLKIPQWGIAAAALLCHRFFAKKSMKRNDRFVIAAACLFLASKVEEAPKPVKEVVKRCEEVRYAKNPNQLKKLNDAAYLEEAKEHVLLAERAVLYTLGFDLNLQHPYKHLLDKLTNLGILKCSQDSPFRNLMQIAWNFINDSFRTTLCLQFPPEKVACAALYLANLVNKRDQQRSLEDLIPQDAGSFFTYFQITAGEVEEICDQLLGMYEESKKYQDMLKAEVARNHAVKAEDGTAASVGQKRGLYGEHEDGFPRKEIKVE